MVPKYISSVFLNINTQKVFFSPTFAIKDSWSASQFFSPPNDCKSKLCHFAVAAVWEVIGYCFVQSEKCHWCNLRLANSMLRVSNMEMAEMAWNFWNVLLGIFKLYTHQIVSWNNNAKDLHGLPPIKAANVSTFLFVNSHRSSQLQRWSPIHELVRSICNDPVWQVQGKSKSTYHENIPFHLPVYFIYIMWYYV